MPSLRRLKTTSAAVIGERLRARRENRGWRQEEVAQRMRSEGLHPWQRVTVAAVEAGTRALSPTEQAGLCSVFRRSWPDFLSLEEDELYLLLEGETWKPEQVAIQTGPTVWVRWLSYIETLRDGTPLYAGSIGGPGPASTDDETVPDETDRKAAKTLGSTPGAVRHAALHLWGRSLSAERDRLLAELAEPGDAPRTLQARRGHITRSLTAELRPSVELFSGKGDR